MFFLLPSMQMLVLPHLLYNVFIFLILYLMLSMYLPVGTQGIGVFFVPVLKGKGGWQKKHLLLLVPLSYRLVAVNEVKLGVPCYCAAFLLHVGGSKIFPSSGCNTCKFCHKLRQVKRYWPAPYKTEESKTKSTVSEAITVLWAWKVYKGYINLPDIILILNLGL